MASSTIQAQTVAGLTPIYVEKLMTIPANSTLEVDLSEYVPTGKQIFAISGIRLGGYVLPYFGSNGTRTYVGSIGAASKKMVIYNEDTAWTNYTIYMILCVA